MIVVRGFGRAHNDLIGSARGVYMGINRRVRERERLERGIMWCAGRENWRYGMEIKICLLVGLKEV